MITVTSNKTNHAIKWIPVVVISVDSIIHLSNTLGKCLKLCQLDYDFITLTHYSTHQ